MWHIKNKNSDKTQNTVSIIDHDCEIAGKFAFVGTLIVNGKFSGELKSTDTLIVGESGDLDAEVEVGTAILAGQIKGRISARNRIELQKSANIFGDLATPTLVAEEGVVFDGQCKMRGKEGQVLQMRSIEPRAPETESVPVSKDQKATG